MVDSLKKIDKKYLIILGTILLIPLLLIIILVIIQGCSNQKISYKKYEEKMMSAAKKYFKEEKKISKEESELVEVSLKELVDKEYVKSTEDLIGDNSCKGTVSIRLNGSNIEKNKGGFYNYIVKLECDDYKTNSLINQLNKDLTTEGNGLYNQNNIYVYKGDDVKNYITFFGKNYRILGIDQNGIVKLLKVEKENLDVYWDIKYNTETSNASGKNIYADSEILKRLISLYNNPKKIKENSKQHMISYDVCIGARDVNDVSLYSENDCSETIDNQAISIINITDFSNASLDSECDSIIAKTCRNYNYLKESYLESWTVNAVSNNTYQVYYLQNGVIDYQDASVYMPYNIVIYIDGNEVIDSGDGSKTSPYVIE